MPLLISRRGREKLALGEGVPRGRDGRWELGDPAVARRAAAPVTGLGLGGATLAALDRLSQAFDALVDRFLADVGGDALASVLEVLERRLGRGPVEELLHALAEEFDLSPAEALGAAGQRVDEPRRSGAIRYLLLYGWLDANPAARSALRVIFGGALRQLPLLPPALSIVQSELSRPAPSGDWPAGLYGRLMEPIHSSPASLAAQLRFAGQSWAAWLPSAGTDLLRAADLVDEETPRLPPGPEPSRPVEEPAFAGLGEVRRFSPDREWMPRLVLIAKNVRVWLHQLSKRNGKPISTLDAIPESELEELARLGCTGLWLIGIWERSPASARIKQLTGNPEALGSAYSIRRYEIAEDLGGDAALWVLAARAGRHGVRLGADMVPNHLAIDSDWVLERPDWFVGSEECPFPGYTFEGPELSPRPDLSVKIEDGYWDRSDAAVVFRYRDLAGGRTRYLYHGNDGTSTPWNDTAQLDFLRPDVRQAVADQILEVARRFPIVRFDAAMTLARRHFQRLWYPPPGGGGAIPSRAERGLTTAEFDAAMPEEFWRTVVDRSARDAPDTLLLAEAFWLMEAYFVRTLGMHRVYNSAFMNLLRNGETGRFRGLLEETLTFDPQILERYVNFMSNPDERTAEEQFGTGDRYFGVCTVMATLPGLPMFAHGQFEGLKERYGMEYARSYVEEEVDAGVLERHRRQIVPLLEDRALFAGCNAFHLFEMREDGGAVLEQVLAYSNAESGRRALVVFNHADHAVRGRLRHSVAAKRRNEEAPRSTGLATALSLPEAGVLRFRDGLTGTTFLARGEEVAGEGLELALAPFEARVLVEFERAVEGLEADEAALERLADDRGMAGVPDLSAALRAQQIEPAAKALARVLDSAAVQGLSTSARLPDEEALDGLESALLELAKGLSHWQGTRLGTEALEGGFHARARGLLILRATAAALARSKRPELRRAGELASRLLSGEVLRGLAWRLAVEALERGAAGWEIEDPVAEWELDGGAVPRAASIGRRRRWGESPRQPSAREAQSWIERWLDPAEGIAEALGCHAYAGEEYLRREPLEEVVGTRLGLEVLAWSDAPTREFRRAVLDWSAVAGEVLDAAEAAGYRVGKLGRGGSSQPLLEQH